MRFDILCCVCKVTKLGEVSFDDSVSQEEGERRACDMGMCGDCFAAMQAQEQQAAGDEPI